MDLATELVSYFLKRALDPIRSRLFLEPWKAVVPANLIDPGVRDGILCEISNTPTRTLNPPSPVSTPREIDDRRT